MYFRSESLSLEALMKPLHADNTQLMLSADVTEVEMFSELDSFSSWNLTVIKFIPLLHVSSNCNNMGLISGRFNYSLVTSLKQLII